MNKLQGFYEMKRMGIPVVPWKPYTGKETFEPECLWTVRVAVQDGFDFNLPRAVGVNAGEALAKARQFLTKLSAEDLVVYYPYFIAIKSGILEIQADKTILEAVEKDLWNLTTLGKKNLTIVINRHTGTVCKYGEEDFLSAEETAEIMHYAEKIRRSYRQYIFGSSSLLLEWHYALHCDAHGNPVGDKYLVFTECKSVGD